MSLLSEIKLNARNRQNNAVATMSLLLRSIRHFEWNGDWTNVAWIVGLAEGSDRARLKAIVEACGFVVKADKKSPSGIRLKFDVENNSSTRGVHILAQLVERGNVSFRSKALVDGIDGIGALLEPEEAVFDLDKIAMAFAKKAAKNDVTEAQMIAALHKAQAKLAAA